jgi:ribosomal protein S18 acetylase RimI-like enzyme
MQRTIIRPFDGSLADAEGLLAVEREAFDESPYSAEQVQVMLSGGAQYAWLAVGEYQVVGFVIAFATTGLRDPCWEIDLLAVHPDWTGRGLATRLIRAASAYGMRQARQARAAVATDNSASARAFVRAGYRRAGLCELLIFRLGKQTPRPWAALGVTIREAENVEAAIRWLPLIPGPGTRSPATTDVAWAVGSAASGESATGREREGLALLLAEHHGQPAGYAELVAVQTLLYRGVWIESLSSSKDLVTAALIHGAVQRAASTGLDEIGMMVPERDQALQEALRAAGFRSLGAFDWLKAGLPLPGLASSQAGEEAAALQGEAGHV